MNHRLDVADFSRTQPIVHPPVIYEDDGEPVTLREIVADIAPAILIVLGVAAFVLWSDVWWPWARRLVAASAVVLAGCGGGEDEPEPVAKCQHVASPINKQATELCA